jgi:PAS domain-containing protein
MRARNRSVGDRLAALAGARLDVLQVAPGARAKYVALGGVLLSTGGLAAISAAFAVHMALGAPWAVAMLLGLGWGVVIVNLDRMLLVGMAHDASVLRTAAMAVPRVALAVLLGTVISTPLTLQVFSKEIDATIVTLQAEAADTFTAKLDADARYAQIPALRQKIGDEQAVLAGGGATDPNIDPRVTAAAADRDLKRQAYDAAQATYADLQAKAQCELDGSCGSGQAGPGDAYVRAAAAASAQAAVRDGAKGELDAAEAALVGARTAAGSDAASNGARSVSMAEADLATDQALLTRLTDARTAEQATFQTQNSHADGLLARLEAMDRLAADRPVAGTAHLMLFLLFLSVELLPVLMKTLLNFGEPTAYEKLEKLRDEEDVEAEKIRRDGRQRAVQARADMVVAAETDRMAREILDREIAAREEAERKAARRAARNGRVSRTLRSVFRTSRPEVAAEDPAELIEPTLDTGELEAMMVAPSAVRMFGTTSVPAPRPAAELLLPVDER